MLLGHRVIQVACGSRDAQTLALTDEGISDVLKGDLWSLDNETPKNFFDTSYNFSFEVVLVACC